MLWKVEIKNTGKRPLKVSLPGGKKLFLGPNATGNVTPKALEHPPLVKLIEAGEIEVLGKEGSKGHSSDTSSNMKGTGQSGHGGGANMRRTGDR